MNEGGREGGKEEEKEEYHYSNSTQARITKRM